MSDFKKELDEIFDRFESLGAKERAKIVIRRFMEHEDVDDELYERFLGWLDHDYEKEAKEQAVLEIFDETITADFDHVSVAKIEPDDEIDVLTMDDGNIPARCAEAMTK